MTKVNSKITDLLTKIYLKCKKIEKSRIRYYLPTPGTFVCG